MAFTEVVDSNNSPVVGEYVTNGTQTVMDGGVTSGGSISGAEGSAAIIVSSGGKVYDLQVNGPNTMIYLRGGELINAQVDNLDPAWYTGDGIYAHMQFSAGVIDNCVLRYGIWTTAGNNGQVIKNTVITGDNINTGGALEYTNFRMGAGTMLNCTVKGAGMMIFGWCSPDGMTFNPVASNTIISESAWIDLRANGTFIDTYMDGGRIYLSGVASSTVLDGGFIEVTGGTLYDINMNGGYIKLASNNGVTIDG
ncbi:MAG: hypothetical protein ACI4OV_03730, partial [Victivallaceae bacterium]